MNATHLNLRTGPAVAKGEHLQAANEVPEQLSPILLTNAELAREAEAVARRIAHSNLPARDATIVIALASRLPFGEIGLDGRLIVRAAQRRREGGQ